MGRAQGIYDFSQFELNIVHQTSIPPYMVYIFRSAPAGLYPNSIILFKVIYILSMNDVRMSVWPKISFNIIQDEEYNS